MVCAFALLFVPVSIYASCPVSVKCAVDGESMFQEGCDYNTGTHHQVCKYGHDHYEDGSKVHHYIYVDCGQ
jgi:hypothetical protein